MENAVASPPPCQFRLIGTDTALMGPGVHAGTAEILPQRCVTAAAPLHARIPANTGALAMTACSIRTRARTMAPLNGIHVQFSIPSVFMSGVTSEMQGSVYWPLVIGRGA